MLVRPRSELGLHIGADEQARFAQTTTKHSSGHVHGSLSGICKRSGPPGTTRTHAVVPGGPDRLQIT
eukprot:1192966-Prorocentrum_minimum.AAC.1